MREKEFLNGLKPDDVAYMNKKKKEYELQNQRDQAAAKLHAEAEKRAGVSPEREFTKEDRVKRHRKFLETQKGLSPQRTIRFDTRDTQRTGGSQLEEGEELVAVVEEDRLDKEELKELKKERADMEEAR